MTDLPAEQTTTTKKKRGRPKKPKTFTEADFTRENLLATELPVKSFTPIQNAFMEFIRQKWMKIGFSTGTTPELMAKAEVLMLEAYERAGFQRPPEGVVWFDSPKAGADYARKRLAEAGETDIQQQISNAIYGCHDAGWLGFYDFWGMILPDPTDGSENPIKKLDKIMAAAEVGVGWWWSFDNVCIATKRPDEMHVDDQFRLHCETGPAIRYPNNDRIYAWHGTVIPDRLSYIIDNPEEITVQKVRAEENVEIRRIMTERMGFGKWLQETGSIVVDMDGGIGHSVGAAPRVLLQEKTPDGRPGDKFLCGTDGSTQRVYFMPVPQEAMTCKQAHELISGINEANVICEC